MPLSRSLATPTAEEVLTPWGRGERLRDRQLPPGRGNTREATTRNQRERLFGAMVACVAAKGYADTSVADLLRLAGVSRSSFYQQFESKQACFMATYDAIVGDVLENSTAAFDEPGPWVERLEAGYTRLLDLIALFPAAGHLCLVDLYGAGPDAEAANARTSAHFERLLRHAFAESPERAELPDVVIQAIIGGNYKLLTSRVRRGVADELARMVPEVAAWALSYRNVPGVIAHPRTRPPTGGGPQFAPYGNAGRIFEAVGLEIAERGYRATTIEGIAARAGASVHTFYNHFESKEDALAAAYDAGLAQSFALVQPALARGIDWPHGLRAALHALLHFLAANPAWTRTAVLESPTAGAALMRRSDEAIDSFASLIRPGLEETAGQSEVAVEATAGAIYALIYGQVRRAGPERLLEILPTCTYVGLAPFVGGERALAVANHGERSGRRGQGGLS